VGRTLVASAPAWNQADVLVTYQWYRDTLPIPGATTLSYVAATTDVGKSISLRATGRKSGFQDVVSASNAVVVTPGDGLVSTAAPTVAGTPAVGQTLTASPGTWNGSPTQFKYQWLHNGTAIAGAVSTTYRPAAADAGQQLSVQVTAIRTGYNNGSASSAPVTVAKMVSKTSATASPATVKRSARTKLSIVVSVTGLLQPTGTLTVKDGRKTLKKLTLSPVKAGKVVVKLPKLKKVGKHKITVVYSGTTTVVGSTSKATKVVVTR
jgi:hypothetical protein